MNSLAIANVTIRRDHSGRFCLNDLHRSSGGAAKHRPGYWLENQHTKELIAEIEIAGIPAIQSKQGLGTFVCKELVYSYAMWVRPSFQLQVIRTFDAIESGKHAELQVPKTLPEALRLAADLADQVAEQNELIERQRPAVEFAHAIKNLSDAISLGDMAKLLGTGRTRFFATLRDDQVLMSDNKPYQAFIDRGYLRLVETAWIDSDKVSHPSFKTVVTGRGQVYLQRRYGQPVTQAA